MFRSNVSNVYKVHLMCDVIYFRCFPGLSFCPYDQCLGENGVLNSPTATELIFVCALKSSNKRLVRLGTPGFGA